MGKEIDVDMEKKCAMEFMRLYNQACNYVEGLTVRNVDYRVVGGLE